MFSRRLMAQEQQQQQQWHSLSYMFFPRDAKLKSKSSKTLAL